jgi:hypothetical protein
VWEVLAKSECKKVVQMPTGARRVPRYPKGKRLKLEKGARDWARGVAQPHRPLPLQRPAKVGHRPGGTPLARYFKCVRKERKRKEMRAPRKDDEAG